MSVILGWKPVAFHPDWEKRSHLHQAGHHVSRGLARLVGDVGFDLDDLACCVALHVGLGLQHHGARLHQHVAELFGRRRRGASLWGVGHRESATPTPSVASEAFARNAGVTHPDVGEFVQVEEVVEVEELLRAVVSDEAWRIDDRPHPVNDPPVLAFERGGTRGCGDIAVKEGTQGCRPSPAGARGRTRRFDFI